MTAPKETLQLMRYIQAEMNLNSLIFSKKKKLYKFISNFKTYLKKETLIYRETVRSQFRSQNFLKLTPFSVRTSSRMRSSDYQVLSKDLILTPR